MAFNLTSFRPLPFSLRKVHVGDTAVMQRAKLMNSAKPPDLVRSDKPAEIEWVSRDARSLRGTGRQPSEPGEQASTLMGLISRETTREINQLIDDLTMLRNKLESENNRIRNDITHYASLSKSAVQLTKVVSDSVTHVKKASDAPSISDERPNSAGTDAQSASIERPPPGEG
jgi:hypothetical protein